jgi:hypothetical protein
MSLFKNLILVARRLSLQGIFRDCDNELIFKPGFGGKYCNRCAPGFRGFPDCTPCPCNAAGSRNFETCEEASCICKVGF